MIVLLAIDALEYTLVEEFNCTSLMQEFYGKTDISDFSEPRTMVLWSSFMTGKNKEEEILKKGDKEMWNTKIKIGETFFSLFEDPKILDLPGFNYEKEQHEGERVLLKEFFSTDEKKEKEGIRKAYNSLSFEHHRKIKEEFKAALKENHDFVLGYFSVADVIGHLNFGNRTMMKMIYTDLDEIAAKIREDLIILSDHGMEKIGVFGDHSNYGFWGTNFRDLGVPKITDFYGLIKWMVER